MKDYTPEELEFFKRIADIQRQPSLVDLANKRTKGNFSPGKVVFVASTAGDSDFIEMQKKIKSYIEHHPTVIIRKPPALGPTTAPFCQHIIEHTENLKNLFDRMKQEDEEHYNKKKYFFDESAKEINHSVDWNHFRGLEAQRVEKEPANCNPSSSKRFGKKK